MEVEQLLECRAVIKILQLLAVGMDHSENGLFVSTGLAPPVIRQFKTLGSASGVPCVPHASELSKVNF